MNKFTPGPWTTTGHFVYGPDDTEIAELAKADNSNLIAAAPELYEALEAVMNGQIGGKPDLDAERFQKARAALAKAKGGRTVNASEIDKRPPIKRICYFSAEGNPHVFHVGRNATEIREVQEYSECCYIPWVEVWDGDKLLARFNQHKLEHIFYEGSQL